MPTRAMVLAGLVSMLPLTAAAVPVLTPSGGATDFLEDSAPVVVDGTLTLTDPSGTNLTGARVSISSGFVAAEDRLAFTAQGGVTGAYSQVTGILTLSGTASPATYQSVLRSVTYQDIQTNNPTTGTRLISFSLGASSLYFPDNGHYYEYVAAPQITWTAANTAASGRTYFGLQGYLVTVTSAAENSFIQSKLSGKGWMGAKATIFTVPRDWSWVTGPEAGTAFFRQTLEGTGAGGGTPIGGLYSNWTSGEPNNYQSSENYAHFFTDGTWNDYANNDSNIQGYVVEYGGLLTDPVTQLSGNKNVQVAACGANCSACSGPATCTTCDSGFTLTAGDCTLDCGANCSACSSPAACSSCNSGYTLAGGACTPIACSANCGTCTSPSTCTACDPGYSLAGGACTPISCSAHCSTCSSPSTCLACDSGYTVAAGSCSAIACSAGCGTCSSPTTCTACNSGYVLSGGACTACSANCTSCSSGTTCTACSSGFNLVTGQCVSSSGSGTIPTLSEWGMLLFSALLALSAFVTLQRRRGAGEL